KDVEVVPPKPPEVGIENSGWSACLCNCFSNCPIKVYSSDGVVTRIEADSETIDDYGNTHQIRSCARGRSLKQRTYAPDRLKTPMKRVGKRGEGKFVPITWEEATSEIAEKLSHIKNEYGNKSIYLKAGSGADYGVNNASACFSRLLNLTGGFLGSYGNYSIGKQMDAVFATYGGIDSPAYPSMNGSSLFTLEDSDLFVSFGFNPSETTQSGSGQGYDYLKALEKNANLEVINIDPRYTDSMLGKENEWLPIRPGTDAALASAIAHEMISSGWVDNNSKEFLDKYCIGYDRESLEALKNSFENSGDANKLDLVPHIDPNKNYKDYIMGEGEFNSSGAKTVKWAAEICGIPEAKIINLADKIKNASAPYIISGASLNRHANGEQNIRSIYMLAILTGKIGQSGVNNGELPSSRILYNSKLDKFSHLNTVKESISFFTWNEAIYRGTEMNGRKDGVKGLAHLDDKLGSNIKAIISVCDASLLNQHSQTNNTRELLEDESLVELIVSCDCWMTSSAKFADIILPDSTWLETDDFVNSSHDPGSMGYLVAMSASVETMWECKSIYDICSLLADKMGIKNEFTEGKSAIEWLELFYDKARNAYSDTNISPAMPTTFSEAQKIGVFKRFLGTKIVALESNIKNNIPFNTPSGKIEIYSTSWAKFSNTMSFTDELGDDVSPIPIYQVTWDGYQDQESAKDYPIQLIGYHTKGRAHSSFHNVPWLREAVEDAIWMNPEDGEARGLSQGDMVHVWNKRGTIELSVRLTPRILPGAAALGQGAWFKPDPEGRVGQSGHVIDIGGCINTLTRYQPTSFSKGNPQHTNRVQIAKA
ncbi:MULTISPECIES: DMSO/selenate family reductase complex A subunit, partial [unclassified Shewanella]|uniref:DMSO/selenate family reductase complex A subunit n=1 Tax=unclassified Shewanella TaxID=196818 RepID=UPI000C79C94B